MNGGHRDPQTGGGPSQAHHPGGTSDRHVEEARVIQQPSKSINQLGSFDIADDGHLVLHLTMPHAG